MPKYSITPGGTEGTWHLLRNGGLFKSYPNRGLAVMAYKKAMKPLSAGDSLPVGQYSHFTGRPTLTGPAFANRTISRAAALGARMNKSKYGRYAVLVCFDGPNAKSNAEASMKSIQGALKDPVDARYARFFNFDLACCLALHDCVQHPLNPKG